MWCQGEPRGYKSRSGRDFRKACLGIHPSPAEAPWVPVEELRPSASGRGSSLPPALGLEQKNARPHCPKFSENHLGWGMGGSPHDQQLAVSVGRLEQCLGSPSPTLTQNAFLSALRHPLMCAAGDRGQSLLPSPSGTVLCLLSDV